MIYASILVSLGYARNYEKGQQIISNIVSDDCRKNKKCIDTIFKSELKNSTHIFLLGTLDKIQTGSLVINGQETNILTEKEVAKFRNKEIGFVFQFHNLLNEFTALENVCLPAYLSGSSKKNAQKKALELLKILGISNRAEHKTDELSGGEQQRVAVARALINSPSILLADEPSGNLDSKNANELHQLFLKLNKTIHQTIIVSTHNKELAKLAHKTLEIKDGKII